MLRALVLCLILPALAAAQEAAEEVAPVTGELLSPQIGTFEAGVFCAPPTDGAQPAPNTVSGTTHVVTENPDFASHGRLVPAALGVGFGAIAGFKTGPGQGDVLMRVTHPPFPEIGATEQSFETWIGPADAPGITYYQFDFPYEMALGDWTLEASLDGEILYRLVFTIVPPETLPDLAGLCGYEHLLS